MDIIIAIIVGAIIGWLASLIMATDKEQGMIANVLVGIAGSLLGKFVFADFLGIGSAWRAGTFSLAGIVWGVIGAIILIAVLKAINVFK